MTRPLFLFVHGWAGTPRLWDGVCARMAAAGVDAADIIRIAPALSREAGEGEEGRPLIGIGHSLGAAWLLAYGPKLSGLISLNGFTRFSAAPGFPGTHPRVLAQMRRRLLADAPAVLAEFHGRAGLALADDPAGAGELAQGLDLLANIDARGAFGVFARPHLALAGTDDAIVPPAHAQACFPDPVMVDGVGHALPLVRPDLCARHILELAARC
ncbi:alpha/beta fold hydrolase [Niveispirillum sp. KHB5.9]|uniref:alpha/beta fold hydrolase n=1 Tax=Niveispirillum sp. KHB5.9 TaxID=3400269 RepID=UPI003A8989BD